MVRLCTHKIRRPWAVDASYKDEVCNGEMRPTLNWGSEPVWQCYNCGIAVDPIEGWVLLEVSNPLWGPTMKVLDA